MKEITKHILLLINTLKLGRAKTYSTNKDTLSFVDNTNTISYAGILLRKIIEQYVALTYDGKPDYEIKSNNDNNNDLNNLFDNNYNNIDKNIKKAVEEYFIWGYACIIIDDLSGELVNIPANKVYVSPEDENILAIEDILDIEQKVELAKQYKVDISDNVVKYIYYSSEGVNYKYIYIPKDQKLLYLCKSLNNKKNCYLESNEYSELSKTHTPKEGFEELKDFILSPERDNHIKNAQQDLGEGAEDLEIIKSALARYKPKKTTENQEEAVIGKTLNPSSKSKPKKRSVDLSKMGPKEYQEYISKILEENS